MWKRYMLIAFVTNGLGAFGMRILAGMGVAGRYKLQYLAFWYGGGCLVAAAVYFLRCRRPYKREVLIGFGMALCSLVGQLGMILSLDRGIPGFVVFPVAVGGGLFFVVAVGRAFFHERLTGTGYLGIVLGSIALVLLSLP